MRLCGGLRSSNRYAPTRSSSPATHPFAGARSRPKARPVPSSSSKFACMARRALMMSALAVGACVDACSKSHSSSVLGDASHPTPVHLYTVAEESAQRRVQAVGSLFPLEESILSSQVEGCVADVLADVGDTVKQDQPLIVLDPQEVQFEVDRQRGQVRQVGAAFGDGSGDSPSAEPQE